MNPYFRFDPIDKDELARWMSLSDTARLQTMLDAREFAVALIRGSLASYYPGLSSEELNLKVLEELERRGKRKIPQFNFVS